MRASKLFLENRLAIPLYAVLRAEAGRLIITVFSVRTPGADEIPPGKAAGYAMNDDLRRCMNGAKLNFEFRNRSTMAILLSAGRERVKEGPILAIEPCMN